MNWNKLCLSSPSACRTSGAFRNRNYPGINRRHWQNYFVPWSSLRLLEILPRTIGRGKLILSMKSICKNNIFLKNMTRASSGSDRKIISRAICQIVFLNFWFFLIRYTKCTKNDLVITVRPKSSEINFLALNYQLFSTQIPFLLLIFILVNYFQWKMSDSRLKCQ